jgi:acetolactate synthase-1/2/3 large subunit
LSPIETVVDRALAITTTEPQGPVYLTPPRSAGERLETFEYWIPLGRRGPTAHPRRGDGGRGRAPRVRARADHHTKAVGRDPEAVASLVALAEALAVPVFEQAPTHMNFPQSHPLHAFDPDRRSATPT